MSESAEIAAAVEWDTGEDERRFASTSDGWRVALYRYRPPNDAGAAKPFPVVVSHGLAGSRYLFDCHPDYSLAITLGLDARS